MHSHFIFPEADRIRSFRFRGMVAALAVCLLLSALCGAPAYAREAIRFASVSWTGVTVKTELGVSILKALGYKAESYMLSVPVAYKAMDTGEADVFLGNWMPSMKTLAETYFAKGTVVKFVPNMTGAQYTLAAPAYVLEGGLKDFSDIVRYADALDHKIYGIEEGNDGNEIIQAMIDADMFGLGSFDLIPSSEAGMLGQVQDAVRNKRWIVFLGWTPHYMNEVMDLGYLTGSTDETFGPENGMATVYTNYRAGFDAEQPNVVRFLANFTFPLDMMNQIMTALHEDESIAPLAAGLAWIRRHPDISRQWLTGVTTRDGKPALPVWEAWLNAQ